MLHVPIVSDVMTSQVIKVPPSMPFKQVAATLAENAISAVPVVDDSDHLLGVVSERDLLDKEGERGTHMPWLLAGRRRWRNWQRAKGVTAADVMSKRPQTVLEDEPVAVAVRRLAAGDVRRLLVVAPGGRLVGVFARRDALRLIMRPDDEIRATIDREVLRHSLWADPGVQVTVNDGIVSLIGDVDQRSEAERAATLAWAIPGVIDVRNLLRYVHDDVAAGADRS